MTPSLIKSKLDELVDWSNQCCQRRADSRKNLKISCFPKTPSSAHSQRNIQCKTFHPPFVLKHFLNTFYISEISTRMFQIPYLHKRMRFNTISNTHPPLQMTFGRVCMSLKAVCFGPASSLTVSKNSLLHVDIIVVQFVCTVVTGHWSLLNWTV